MAAEILRAIVTVRAAEVNRHMDRIREALGNPRTTQEIVERVSAVGLFLRSALAQRDPPAAALILSGIEAAQFDAQVPTLRSLLGVADANPQNVAVPHAGVGDAS